jgi:RimJ/RimL family protein N-acetyltransferase
MKELKTERLRITPLTAEQMGMLIKKPQPDEHLEAALLEMYTGCVGNPKDFLWYTNWQIFLRSDDTYIGSLCFMGAPLNGAVEIGYGIDNPYENQGYASEAVKALTEWAFTNQGVCSIMAETDHENLASMRVLEKNGFVRAGDGEEGPRWAKEKTISN